MDVKEEARKAFESLLETFAEYKANMNRIRSLEAMEYDREEIDNLVYSIRKIETYELQLAGGGPAYWVQFDVDNQEVKNIKFKYAWWSSPVLISYYQMTDEEYEMMEWFVEEFIGGDVSWLEDCEYINE
tara:strand:- start:1245 stop:1631 length:387 start_codon:yes stop_codon:yes gene_type:complete